MSTPVIRVEDGAVAIAGRPILRGIDLEVPAGQFLAVMGANGSGKSTLVRAMTGLQQLTRGTVELFGVPLAEFDDWHRIGFVPAAGRRRRRRARLGTRGGRLGPADPAPAAPTRRAAPTGPRSRRRSRSSAWPTGPGRASRPCPAASSSGC